MEPWQNNKFDPAGWQSWTEHRSEAQDEASIVPDPDNSLQTPQSHSPAPGRGAFADPTSRRKFLRTTVIAGAAVTGVAAAAGGLVYAAKRPQILTSVKAGNAAPSGQCAEITQGVKGSPSNPNQHIQVSTSDYLAYIGTISGSTFTIKHGVAVLVDKNGHNPNLSTCIKGAAYDNGNVGQVILTVDPGVTTTSEYPAGSCLYVNQNLGTC